MLIARELAVGHADGPLLSSLDFELRPGEVVGLTGPNGCGKSTLLLTLAGLHPAIDGAVRLTAGARCVLLPPRTEETPLLRLRAAERVALFAGGDRADRAKRVDEALDAMGLRELARRSDDQFSTGEAQRLRIACVIATGADCLLLDEPTLGLDRVGIERLAAWLREGPGRERRTVLFASHDPRLIQTAGRLLEIEQGCVLHGHHAHEAHG